MRKLKLKPNNLRKRDLRNLEHVELNVENMVNCEMAGNKAILRLRKCREKFANFFVMEIREITFLKVMFVSTLPLLFCLLGQL